MTAIGRRFPPVPGLLAWRNPHSLCAGRNDRMNRPVLGLLLSAALAIGGLVGVAQGPREAGAGKNTEPEKEAAKGDAAKGKEKDKEPIKPKSDKSKLPPGIVLIPNPLDKTLSMWPAMAVMSLEEYQALREQLEALKKQLKDKTTAHFCEMTGRLEGDYLALRGEFIFATLPDEPRKIVTLGLKGAVLTEKGDLDGQPPVLDYTAEDGFVVRD